MDDPRSRAAGLYRIAVLFHAGFGHGAGTPFAAYRDQMAFRHAMQCAWLEVENAKLVRQIPERETLEGYRRGGPSGTSDFDEAARAAEVAAAWLEEPKTP